MLEADLQGRAASSKRILFAEDDVDIASLVTEELRNEGFDVTYAENGDAAAAVLESRSFHLLLTDVRMPGAKDGIELAMHARRKSPKLPIVIASGYAEGLGLRIGGLGAGVTLVSKPFLLTNLLGAIWSSLAAAPQSIAEKPRTIFEGHRCRY